MVLPNEITEERRDLIVKNYLNNLEKRKQLPPTPEQRKQWNQKHYAKRKASPDWEKKQKEYYANHKEKRREKAKVDYYKKTNNLEGLKTKYPDIYEKYISV